MIPVGSAKASSSKAWISLVSDSAKLKWEFLCVNEKTSRLLLKIDTIDETNSCPKAKCIGNSEADTILTWLRVNIEDLTEATLDLIWARLVKAKEADLKMHKDSLNNRSIAVIGSDSNLGKAVIDVLDSENNNIIKVSRKSVKAEGNSSHREIKCDLESNQDVESLTKYLNKTQTIKGLVFIAGGYPTYQDIDGTLEDWRNETLHLVQTHSTSYAYIAESVLNNNEEVSIVYVSSTSTFWKGRRNMIYAAAKAHAEQMMLTICNIHKESTSRINVVRLGTMEKAFKATSRDYDEKMHESRIKMLPRGEAIKYRDVSIVINFLLSSKSKAINGNIIRLDNGESVRGNN